MIKLDSHTSVTLANTFGSARRLNIMHLQRVGSSIHASILTAFTGKYNNIILFYRIEVLCYD